MTYGTGKCEKGKLCANEKTFHMTRCCDKGSNPATTRTTRIHSRQKKRKWKVKQQRDQSFLRKFFVDSFVRRSFEIKNFKQAKETDLRFTLINF